MVLSDDQRMLVQSTGSSAVVELVVFAKTAVASAATIDLLFEGRLSSGTMTNGAKLALWDWTADPPAWVDQDRFTINSTEPVRTKTGIAAAGYIHSDTGLIKYRVRLAPSFWLTTSFTVQADQMKVVVKE